MVSRKRLLDSISGRGATLATPHNRYVHPRGLCLYHSTGVYVQRVLAIPYKRWMTLNQSLKFARPDQLRMQSQQIELDVFKPFRY